MLKADLQNISQPRHWILSHVQQCNQNNKIVDDSRPSSSLSLSVTNERRSYIFY